MGTIMSWLVPTLLLALAAVAFVLVNAFIETPSERRDREWGER